VIEAGETYVCHVPHTSGTFATDLAAEKWIKVAQRRLLAAYRSLLSATSALWLHSLPANSPSVPAPIFSAGPRQPSLPFNIKRASKTLRTAPRLRAALPNMLIPAPPMALFHAQPTSKGTTVVTIIGTKTFALQHRVAASRATNGLGVPCNLGIPEVYARLEITKIG
jgi:hypothetical protein